MPHCKQNVLCVFLITKGGGSLLITNRTGDFRLVLFQ